MPEGMGISLTGWVAGYLECAQLLVEAGAADPGGIFAKLHDPDKKMLKACVQKDAEGLKKALELGADCDAVDTDYYGYTGLHHVCSPS